jgi:hypothetical protein
MYPQQPYPSPHQAAQAGFSMPPRTTILSTSLTHNNPNTHNSNLCQLVQTAHYLPALSSTRLSSTISNNKHLCRTNGLYHHNTSIPCKPNGHQRRKPHLRFEPTAQASVSAESDAAFRAAQEKLDILRHLGGGSGSP